MFLLREWEDEGFRAQSLELSSSGWISRSQLDFFGCSRKYGDMTVDRSILHVDMDAFYAAVEQMDDPDLRGRPVLVGSDAPRGVVATASYEARPFGCHSAQPMAVAKRLCPHAVVVSPRGHRYRQVSEQVLALFLELTPLVEPISIDEAFLDITGTRRLWGPPRTVAQKLQRRIHVETGLTASIGMAPNKFLAKLGSELNKPNSLTVIRSGDIDHVLPPLPLTKLWGIGPATAEQFERLGVSTFGDLRKLSLNQLHQIAGSAGEHFRQLARGLDDRPVTPDSRAKSIGHEQTFVVDLEEADEVRRVLLTQAEQVSWRLRKQGLFARSVVVKIRYGDFQTITRSMSLPRATDVTNDLWQAARILFDRWVKCSYQPVRLIGIAAQNLVERQQQQLDLFPDRCQRRQNQLDCTMDEINDRFGRSAIHRGPPSK